MNRPLHYFAYGSNLHPGRMVARVPSAMPSGTAVLTGHRLRFHKRSQKDGSGKCDAHFTGNPADRVYGAVYTLDPVQREALDAFEGSGYAAVEVEVIRAGERLPVFLYRARPETIGRGLQPYDWYHDFVVHGARHHDLPENYIAALEGVRSLPDPDPDRAAVERALLATLPTLSSA